MKDFLLSYDTVCLRPRHSSLETRNDADTSFDFCGWNFKLPVVPANMKDVIDRNTAHYLSENNFFYIYHRFGDEDTTETFVRNANEQKWKLVSISVGVNEEAFNQLRNIKNDKQRVDFITIDIAHGDHEKVKPIVSFVRKTFPNAKLIAGNVATGDGALYLASLGVDAIKVGIGGGSICTTRYMTGFHLPTLQSVHEAHAALKKSGQNIPLIADSGAKHYGDVAKAIVFGASMVMSGSWFASCIDSPAKIIDGKKLYRGSTSYEAKRERNHIEGRTLELKQGVTYADRMEEIKQALQSSISYAGGRDLSIFNVVEWERIFNFL